MEQLVIHLVNLRFTIGLLWLGEISTFSSAKSFTVFTWTATVKPWALKTKNKKKGLKRLKCSIIWGKWRGCYIFCRFSQSLIPLTHTHSIIIHPTTTAWKTTSPQCAGLPPVTQTDPSDDGQTLRGVLWCLDTGYWCWILSVLLLVFREQALQCRLIVWCLVCNSVYSISACWKSFQINARTYCSTRRNFFFYLTRNILNPWQAMCSKILFLVPVLVSVFSL